MLGSLFSCWNSSGSIATQPFKLWRGPSWYTSPTNPRALWKDAERKILRRVPFTQAAPSPLMLLMLSSPSPSQCLRQISSLYSLAWPWEWDDIFTRKIFSSWLCKGPGLSEALVSEDGGKNPFGGMFKLDNRPFSVQIRSNLAPIWKCNK